MGSQCKWGLYPEDEDDTENSPSGQPLAKILSCSLGKPSEEDQRTKGGSWGGFPEQSGPAS